MWIRNQTVDIVWGEDDACIFGWTQNVFFLHKLKPIFWFFYVNSNPNYIFLCDLKPRKIILHSRISHRFDTCFGNVVKLLYWRYNGERRPGCSKNNSLVWMECNKLSSYYLANGLDFFGWNVHLAYKRLSVGLCHCNVVKILHVQVLDVNVILCTGIHWCWTLTHHAGLVWQ